MADIDQLAIATSLLIETSPAPVPITLLNHSIDEAAAIIGAVVEKCDRDGIKLEQVCLDPELGSELGLVEGVALPHGGRPTVRIDAGLGRQVLFKRR
jgi:hypothetical protein